MSSLSEKSAFEAFARMEERIETNERQIKASAEIEEEFTGDRLQRDFKMLEKGATSVSVDNQLLALKQKMGMLPAGTTTNKALGTGKREEETVAAEIERPGDEKPT
jgi:phage shock protein A